MTLQQTEARYTAAQNAQTHSDAKRIYQNQRLVLLDAVAFKQFELRMVAQPLHAAAAAWT